MSIPIHIPITCHSISMDVHTHELWIWTRSYSYMPYLYRQTQCMLLCALGYVKIYINIHTCVNTYINITYLIIYEHVIHVDLLSIGCIWMDTCGPFINWMHMTKTQMICYRWVSRHVMMIKTHPKCAMCSIHVYDSIYNHSIHGYESHERDQDHAHTTRWMTYDHG
jgi:hypothetical protein